MSSKSKKFVVFESPACFEESAFLPSATVVAERVCFYTCLSVILFTGDVWADTPRWKDTPLRDSQCSGQYAFYWNAFLFSLSTGVNHCDRWTSPYRDLLGPPPVHGLPTLWIYSNLLNIGTPLYSPLSKYVRSCSL